jgi:hypothetical protein
MRRLSWVALSLLALGFIGGHEARADDVLLGTLTSSGASVNNSTTAVPFTIPVAAKVTLQCDAAAYIIGVTTAAGTVSSSTGERLDTANAFYDVDMNRSRPFLAMIQASGSANCKVFARVR